MNRWLPKKKFPEGQGARTGADTPDLFQVPTFETGDEFRWGGCLSRLWLS